MSSARTWGLVRLLITEMMCNCCARSWHMQEKLSQLIWLSLQHLPHSHTLTTGARFLVLDTKQLHWATLVSGRLLKGSSRVVVEEEECRTQTLSSSQGFLLFPPSRSGDSIGWPSTHEAASTASGLFCTLLPLFHPFLPFCPTQFRSRCWIPLWVLF